MIQPPNTFALMKTMTEREWMDVLRYDFDRFPLPICMDPYEERVAFWRRDQRTTDISCCIVIESHHMRAFDKLQGFEWDPFLYNHEGSRQMVHYHVKGSRSYMAALIHAALDEKITLRLEPIDHITIKP